MAEGPGPNNPYPLTDADGNWIYHDDGSIWWDNEPPPPGWNDTPRAATTKDVDDAIDQLGTNDPDKIKKWLEHHNLTGTDNLPQSDFSPGVNDADVQNPDTGLGWFDSFTGSKGGVSINPENPTAYTFQTVLDAFRDVTEPVDGGYNSIWTSIGDVVQRYTTDFGMKFFELDGWDGETAKAVKANVAAFTNPTNGPIVNLVNGVRALGKLEYAFAQTMTSTKNYIVPNEQAYQEALQRWPQHRDEVLHDFNSFAQKVLSVVYVPSITDIAKNNPTFGSGTSPDLNPNTGGGDGGNGKDAPPPPKINIPDIKMPDLKFPDLDKPPPPDTKNLNSEPPPDIKTPDVPPPDLKNLNTEPPPDIKTPDVPPPDLNNLNTEPPPDINTPDINGPTDGDSSGFQNASSGNGGAVNLTDPDAVPPPPGFDTQLPGGGQDLGALTSSSGGANGVGSQGLGALTSPAVAGGGLSGLSNALGSAAGAVTGPASAAKGLLSDRAKSGAGALGPAADAAEQALNAATKGNGANPGGPLGPGAKGLSGLGGPDGAHVGSGGGGAGVGARGLDLSRPAGAPVAAVSKGPDLSAPGRAGVTGSQGTSTGGGGQPSGGGGGAGQRGPNGKEHKANKALRRKKNGEDIFGEIDAVVPVLGDDQAEQRGDEGGQQPARPPVGARRSPQPQRDLRFGSTVEPGQTVEGR